MAEQGKNSGLQNFSSDLFMFYHTTFHKAPSSSRLFIPQLLKSFMYTPPSRNYLVYYMGKRQPEAPFNNEHHESLPILKQSCFPVCCLSSVSKPDRWVSYSSLKNMPEDFSTCYFFPTLCCSNHLQHKNILTSVHFLTRSSRRRIIPEPRVAWH